MKGLFFLKKFSKKAVVNIKKSKIILLSAGLLVNILTIM